MGSKTFYKKVQEEKFKKTFHKNILQKTFYKNKQLL